MRVLTVITVLISAVALTNGMEMQKNPNTKRRISEFRFSELQASAKNPDVLSLLMALMGLLNPLTGGAGVSGSSQTLGPGGPGMTYPPVSKNVQEYLDKAVDEAKSRAIAQMAEFNSEKDLGNDLMRVAEERLKKYWFIGQCRRDYSRTCPLMWNESEDGNGLCEPPLDYQGPCRAANMKNSSPLQREDFAWRCEAQWPCFAATARNYNEPCPSLWVNVGANLCIAPDHYNGGCSPAMDFKGFSKEEKARWETRCFAQWPSIPRRQTKVRVVHKSKEARKQIGGPISEEGNVKTV